MNRKLDAAITEALGYGFVKRLQVWKHAGTGDEMLLPYYSFDGNDMLELDAEMRKRGYDLFLNRYFFVRPPGERNEILYAATYYFGRLPKTDKTKQCIRGVRYAETEPLARALAAYHALTGKEYEEENRGGKVSE